MSATTAKRACSDEVRFRFPRPFPGSTRMVAIVNGYTSLLMEGTWERKGNVYRRLREDGQTLITPTHYVREEGAYYEYAILDDPKEGKLLLYWVRFAH